MAKKRIHGSRAMLNSPGHHATGAIVAEVEDSSAWPKKEAQQKWRRPYYTFQFANCDRSIAFELDWDTKAERENTLDKIDTMIEVLQEFRAGVALEQARFVRRKKDQKKKKKVGNSND